MHAYFCFSHFWLCVTLWTIVCQAPLSMGFSWQEYWNRLPCSVLFLFFFVNLATYLSILLTFQRTWIWFHHLSFLLNFLFPFCGFLLAYYFFCLFWLSLAFLFLGFWSSSLDFSSFLMYTFSAINYLLGFLSFRFWYVVFHLHSGQYVYTYFLWYFFYPRIVLEICCTVSKYLEIFPVTFLLLMLSPILLWSESVVCMIVLLLNLRFILWLRILSFLVYIPWALERNIYSAVVGRVFCKYWLDHIG